jgi:hypothetical protein
MLKISNHQVYSSILCCPDLRKNFQEKGADNNDDTPIHYLATIASVLERLTQILTRINSVNRYTGSILSTPSAKTLYSRRSAPKSSKILKPC